MGSLIRYLIKNHALLLFILLEFFSLILFFNFNNYQQVKYLNSANRISGAIYAKIDRVSGYFNLATINQKLAEENSRLKTEINSGDNKQTLPVTFYLNSSQTGITNKYISARVINNLINKSYNYITLNKGRKDGIKTDQGIICSEGVVGIVAYVSDSYSLGLSLLNPRWELSAKLKNTGSFGPLSWEGIDYRYGNLKEIPLHVQIAEGHTIVTSGFSSIFPEGIMIGTIQSFSQPGGENNYNIKVRLSTDFVRLSYVDVIENTSKEEIEMLENRINEDEKTGN